jgi:hypothetical protein
MVVLTLGACHGKKAERRAGADAGAPAVAPVADVAPRSRVEPIPGGEPEAIGAGRAPRVRVLVSGRRGIAGIAVDQDWVVYTDAAAGVVARVPRAGGAIDVLARGEQRPHGVAIDATGVTWTTRGRAAGGEVGGDYEGGALRRIGKRGGAPRTLAGGLRDPIGVVEDGADAWVVCRGSAVGTYLDGALVSVPLAGGKAVTRIDELAEGAAVALDEQHAYVSVIGDSSVRRVGLAGGASETIASEQDRVMAIAAARGRVVWARQGHGDGEGAIVSSAATGGAPTFVAKGLDQPVGVVVDGDTVVWLEDGADNNDTLGVARLRARRGDGPVETWLSRPPGAVGLVAYGGFAYVAFHDAIFEVPIAPGAARELPAPEVIAPARGQPRGIAVVGGRAVWASYEGAVLRAGAKAGDEPEVLWHGARGVSSLASGAGALAWTGWDEGAVWALPDGGKPIALATGLGHPVAAAFVPGGVAFVRQDDGGVWRVPLGSGAPVAIAEHPGHGRALAVWDGKLAWIADDGHGHVSILAAPLGGGVAWTVVDETGDALELAADGKDLYWLDSDPEATLPQSRGRLWRIGPGKDDAPELIAAGLPAPAALVVSGGFAYLALTDGSVARLPVAGGTIEPIAGGGHNVGAIAVQGGAVWIASGGTLKGDWKDGAILRAAIK